MADRNVARDYDCKGAALQVVAPGIDNLADHGFNDKVSSFGLVLALICEEADWAMAGLLRRE